MNLSLDHTQRLNLITVLGSQDVKGRELHAVWHLLDLLDLDEEEKRSIDLRVEGVNGQTYQRWDDSKISSREFVLGASELLQLRVAIENFAQFRGARDRVWLQPLLEQLDNGKGGA